MCVLVGEKGVGQGGWGGEGRVEGGRVQMEVGMCMCVCCVCLCVLCVCVCVRVCVQVCVWKTVGEECERGE